MARFCSPLLPRTYPKRTLLERPGKSGHSPGKRLEQRDRCTVAAAHKRSKSVRLFRYLFPQSHQGLDVLEPCQKLPSRKPARSGFKRLGTGCEDHRNYSKSAKRSSPILRLDTRFPAKGIRALYRGHSRETIDLYSPSLRRRQCTPSPELLGTGSAAPVPVSALHHL